MPDVPLLPSEVNDIVRSSMIGVRVVLTGSLEHSPDREAIIAAASAFEFPSDPAFGDHSAASFECKGVRYFFSMEQDKALPKISKDGTPQDGRVMTIGLCG